MMSAGSAFARAASQPIMSGVRDFCIAADTSPRQQAIKQNLGYADAKITSERLRWIPAAREPRFLRRELFRPEQRLCRASWTPPWLLRRAKHRQTSEMRLPKTKHRTAQSVSSRDKPKHCDV